MSENSVKATENTFEKIHLQLFEKIDKEMEAFKASYKSFDAIQIYNDWYIIGFYESYYEMMSCDFLENEGAEEEIVWLSGKEKPLEFLYNEWMDSDGAFSHNWDDMLGFLRTVYEEELSREPILMQSGNNHLGEFDIPALMNTLANNAWYGREPTQMCLVAGEDIIRLDGYTYEPGYEDFSSTASISFNDEVLYGVDSRNIDAFKNEVYDIGRYKTLEEAISYIKEKIKGKELVLLSESQKLDEKINSATARAKQSEFRDGFSKDEKVLER